MTRRMRRRPISPHYQMEWPAPGAPTCSAVAEDISTGREIRCCLRRGHDATEHYWQEITDGRHLSAFWIGPAAGSRYKTRIGNRNPE